MVFTKVKSLSRGMIWRAYQQAKCREEKCGDTEDNNSGLSLPVEDDSGPEIGVRFFGPNLFLGSFESLELIWGMLQGLIKGAVKLQGFFHLAQDQGGLLHPRHGVR